MWWIFNLNFGVQHLAFELNGQHVLGSASKFGNPMLPSFMIENVLLLLTHK
jgi:hypothetical protein